MKAKSLQQGLDEAGSAVKLLWRPNSPASTVPVVPPEYEGWRKEQAAWRENVALLDLCHHMCDLFVEGPDATRLLAGISANNYQTMRPGRATQLIPVTEGGNIISDAILFCWSLEKYQIVGLPAAHAWVMYHAESGNYDVKLTYDPSSDFREGDPLMFRYQVQGPQAVAVVERAFGGPLPEIKFFNFAPVSLNGRTIYALRHGMAGQPGYEIFGDWEHRDEFVNAILTAGRDAGIVKVGGLAYYSAGIESGWIPVPTPGIYTLASMRPYREYLNLFSYEGQFAFHGTFYSENIEDYYCSPWELGYGRSLDFNHDYIGKEALQAARDTVSRTKVTLVWHPDDVRELFGEDHDFILSYTKDRVELDGKLVGMSMYAGSIDPLGTICSLALIDKEHAVEGKELVVLWGQHPGPTAPPDYRPDFARLRCTVQPAPLTEHARTLYRKN